MMTIHWKAVEQYVTVVLFVFQFSRVCNFGYFIILDLALKGVKGFNNCMQIEFMWCVAVAK